MLALVRVHLVRHGQVENPNHILYGRQPGWSLSALGHRMAQRIADWSAPLELGALLVSPLQRAQETAAPIAELHKVKIITEERLIEAANVFEGKPFGVGDGVFKHPGAWRHLFNPWRPSWGEPYVDQINRMLASVFAAREAALSAGRAEAICVSHQLPIWILRSYIEGRWLIHDPRRRECSLCSVTTIHFDGDGMIVGTSYQEPALDLLPSKR